MTDSERFRLFIAVEIPETVKASMEEAQADLRRALPECHVRWARREQFHLTLRFLGDVEAARVEALTESLLAACRAFGAVHLRAERVGCFPDLRRPRVVWAGVRDETEQLPRLQQVVEAATAEFTSEDKEERFTGHVTLARIKGIKRAEAETLGAGGRRHGGADLRPMDRLHGCTHAERALAPRRPAHLHRIGRPGQFTGGFGLTRLAPGATCLLSKLN